MKQIAINYGKVLFLLGIDRQDIKQTEEIWNGSEPLREAMNSPGGIRGGEEASDRENISGEDAAVSEGGIGAS